MSSAQNLSVTRPEGSRREPTRDPVRVGSSYRQRDRKRATPETIKPALMRALIL
jgi:hypothetical protein